MTGITNAGTVADEIRVALARRRKSQVWLAKQVRMHPSTMSRRLSGTGSFTLAELTAVAAVLDMPLAALLSSELGQVPA